MDATTLEKYIATAHRKRQTSVYREVSTMCYNCGCGDRADDHGKGHMGVDVNGKAITDKTFEAAGKAFDMSERESKSHTKDLLNK